jgi:hypothetical protein
LAVPPWRFKNRFMKGIFRRSILPCRICTG